MKKNFFRILGIALILSLLVLALPVSPIFAATLAIAPSSGLPGTTVNITGIGFGPSLQIAITFDGTEVDWPATTTAGTLTASFTVPANKAAGIYALGAVSYGSISNPAGFGTPLTLSPAVNFTVTGTGTTGGGTTTTATLTLDPGSSTVGTNIQILGSGFGASKTYTVYYDIDEIKVETGSSSQSNSSGELKAFVIIPPNTAGGHTIKVKDSAGTEGKATLTVKPKITFTPAKGAPNSNVSVTGTGFGRNSIVTIFFGDNDIGAKPQADSNGGLQYQFIILQKQPGDYAIKGQDENGNTATSVDKFKLELPATINISPDKGGVGTKVNISGIAFKQSSTITVTYNDQPKTTPSDSNGSFSMTLIIPESKSGAHKITISDGTNTKEFTFTVESTPPTVPKLNSPAVYAQLQEPTKLVWGKSTDESLPITYDLQVSPDSGFSDSSIVLEKKGLKETEYLPTKDEWSKLAPTPPPPGSTQIIMKNYYWRVKAIDATGTESKDWATPSLFSVLPPKETPATTPAPTPTTKQPTKPEGGAGTNIFSKLPLWAIGVIGFIVVLLFWIIGFWMGRKTAYY